MYSTSSGSSGSCSNRAILGSCSPDCQIGSELGIRFLIGATQDDRIAIRRIAFPFRVGPVHGTDQCGAGQLVTHVEIHEPPADRDIRHQHGEAPMIVPDPGSDRDLVVAVLDRVIDPRDIHGPGVGRKRALEQAAKVIAAGEVLSQEARAARHRVCQENARGVEQVKVEQGLAVRQVEPVVVVFRGLEQEGIEG